MDETCHHYGYPGWINLELLRTVGRRADVWLVQRLRVQLTDSIFSFEFEATVPLTLTSQNREKSEATMRLGHGT